MPYLTIFSVVIFVLDILIEENGPLGHDWVTLSYDVDNCCIKLYMAYFLCDITTLHKIHK